MTEPRAPRVPQPTELVLDTARFPGRRSLDYLRRGRMPLSRPSWPWYSLQAALWRRWAALLGVQADDLVVCATATEAYRLLVAALLAPADVAILAEPVDPALLNAVAAAGASWLDVSRGSLGAIDPASLTLASERHPQAVVFGEAPNVFGGDDAAVLATVTARASVLDARAGEALAGDFPATRQPRPLATLISLRDPDNPAEPLLYAWVCAPEVGPPLRSLLGLKALSPHLMPVALAALDRLQADGPTAQRAFSQQLAQARARFDAVAAEWPGAIIHGNRGVRATAECAAGDADGLATRLRSAGLPATAWGPHPTRNLVVCELAEALPAPR